MSLREIQKEQYEWSHHNFGHGKQNLTVPGPLNLLGIMEELGELAHSHLKEEQGIRGDYNEHQVNAKDAIGDLSIYLLNYCSSRGWDYEQIVHDTWEVVKRRDWKKYPFNGVTK